LMNSPPNKIAGIVSRGANEVADSMFLTEHEMKYP
jgi:hypothetical protein